MNAQGDLHICVLLSYNLLSMRVMSCMNNNNKSGQMLPLHSISVLNNFISHLGDTNGNAITNVKMQPGTVHSTEPITRHMVAA